MTAEKHLKGVTFSYCVNYTTVILISKSMETQEFAPKSLCQAAAEVSEHFLFLTGVRV